MNYLLFSGLLILGQLDFLQGSRVLELSDKFAESRKDGINWFVMFYAPWCGHCKNLEPTWNQVAQSFHRSPIYVGRIDCTRFPSIASEFKVKGFPTVMLIKADQSFTYNGDRTKDALVDFALRMSRPAIEEVTSAEQFHSATKTQPVLFVFVGPREGALWEAYNTTAHEFQAQTYFYHSECISMVNQESTSKIPAISVYKDGIYDTFPEPIVELEPLENNAENNIYYKYLRRWVNNERFPLVSKVTHGSFHQALRTEKFVVLALLEEDESGNLPESMEEYRKRIEQFALENRQKYHNLFLFGWTPSAELISTFALMTLHSPSIIVINSTTFQYHLLDHNSEILNEEILAEFLAKILSGDLPAYGGTGIGTRFYRVFYDTSTSIRAMWQGNPLLTIVLFGLPLGFLSLICYSICCADFVDDAEEEPETHEKEE